MLNIFFFSQVSVSSFLRFFSSLSFHSLSICLPLGRPLSLILFTLISEYCQHKNNLGSLCSATDSRHFLASLDLFPPTLKHHLLSLCAVSEVSQIRSEGHMACTVSSLSRCNLSLLCLPPPLPGLQSSVSLPPEPCSYVTSLPLQLLISLRTRQFL